MKFPSSVQQQLFSDKINMTKLALTCVISICSPKSPSKFMSWTLDGYVCCARACDYKPRVTLNLLSTELKKMRKFLESFVNQMRSYVNNTE